MSAKRFLYANDERGAYPPSYYAASANPIAPFAAAEGAIACDVCIVGGGYTGLSAALHLAERGYDVVLLEAHRVGWGASGRNGGQVGSGQRKGQDELEAAFGRETAQRLWQVGEQAKALVWDLVERHGIACELKPGVLHADHKRRYVEHSRRYADKLRRDYGYDRIRFVPQDEVRAMLATTAYYGGTLDSGAGHLHPLNFALGLAEAARRAGARIFELSPVLSYTADGKARARLAEAEVTADFLLLACNGYLDGLEPGIARRVMPINNFIVATEPLPEATARALIRDDVAVADSRFVINYFRLSGDRRLLFGGGETYRYDFPRDIKAFVRRPLLRVYPQLAHTRLDYGWGGTLAITRKRLPLFARPAPAVLSAGGYSGQGVALGTLAGQILAEAVDGTLARFDLMAALPAPPFPGGPALRWPLLVLAMTWYALRDRL